MAGQARESQVFFRLQLKAPPREPVAAVTRPDPAPRPTPRVANADATTLLALRAAERARALASGDVDLLANDTSEQTRKLSFLKSGPETEIYNPHGLQKPVSPYQLMAGTIIAASLVSGLSSDLPGFVIAQVTENVYDTVTGRHLLVPQGSRLVGKYDNVVAFGQERALVVWQRIILPDGSSVVIDNLPATDTGGYAGLADQVDLHTWKLLKGDRPGNCPRRRQPARLRLLRQRSRQGPAAIDAVDHQPRRPAPGRAQSQCAADHYRAAGLATARDRAQGHRAAALPRTNIEVSKQGVIAMPVIGTFSAVKDGYAGTIRTLTMTARVRMIANDRKDGEGAPDFRIMAGTAEIGAAWRKTKQGSEETYLRVKLDDPTLPQPIWGALLEATEDGVARLLWRRERKDEG